MLLRKKPRYDFFVSYKSEDVMFVRPVAESRARIRGL
jgi:hypothetical protein